MNKLFKCSTQLSKLTKTIRKPTHGKPAYWLALGRGYSDDPAKLNSCLENINKAVEINNNDFEAHRMLAEVHITLHDFENKDAGPSLFA